jgi:hypothetical protein
MDIRWLDLMPKHAFFYPSRSNVCKDHFPWMSLHLQVSQPESGFLREWLSSLRPLRPLSLGIRYILSNLTVPWTTFGISLFKQILCKGELDVCTTLLRAILCATSLTSYDSLC